MPQTLRPCFAVFFVPSCVCLLLSCLVALPGCDQSGSELDLDNITTYTTAPFAEALQASVIAGRVNYPVIAKGYVAPLDKYLELFATRGPETRRQTLIFTLEHQKAAYYVNVHNALIVKCWLEHGAGSGDPDLQLDPAWLDEKRWEVDGQTMSINDVGDLARKVTRPETPDVISYPLIALALSTGTVTGPPMPSTPLESEKFEGQLINHIRGYFAAADTFVVNGEQVIAPPILREIEGVVSDFEFFLDVHIPETYDNKLKVLQAARRGNFTYREPSQTIHMPHGTAKPTPDQP